MAQERKGGLGRGLAALIPSAPAEMDKSGKTGPIGGGASDIIFGKQSADGAKGAGAEGAGVERDGAERDPNPKKSKRPKGPRRFPARPGQSPAHRL